MPINKAWHEKHRMPKNPTFGEKLKWHKEHQKRCSCRPIPAGFLKEMEKRGLAIPPQE
jgi:hypothetical protein